MEAKIARFISIILHPMFIITWAMLIMLNLNAYFVSIIPERLRWTIIGLVFANTTLVPAILVWIMARKDLISSLDMPLRRERTMPYMIFAIFYASTYFLMKQIGLPGLYYLFVVGGLAGVIAATIINLFWKISIHMIGIGGLTAGFIVLSFKSLITEPLLIMSLILLSGLAGFARLQSGNHTPAQVYTGYLLGAGIVGTLFLVF